MKAAVYEVYGGPEVVKVKEVEQSVPGDNEILVKVIAASVNSWDWDRLTGKPVLYRLLSGITKPRLKILGADIAGVVESIGKNIKNFKVGDEVFGDTCAGQWGGFAEYVIAREEDLSLKSKAMSFEQAAAMPQAGVMALQAIRDTKPIKPGEKILMNGGGGGVGTFLIQLAKDLNAHVTAVDNEDKLDLLTKLGADETIDYRRVDFTRNNLKYDLIIDVVANRSVFNYRRSLSPTGVMMVVGGKISTILQVAFWGPIITRIGAKKIGILIHKPNKYLEELKTLFESGKLKPVIDKVYPLSQTGDALRQIGEGRVKGKLIIKI